MLHEVEKWINQDGEPYLENIGLKKNYTVLDFGCGEGHYTIPAAKVVGEQGKVYAVDKSRFTLDELMDDAKSQGLDNIFPVVDHSEELDIDLEEGSVDFMLFYDVLHFIEPEKRRKVYKNACKLLKSGGILSVYPKHIESNMPMIHLANVNLDELTKEIESTCFSLVKKELKHLFHDDYYDEGYILNFRK
ncbi:MAG: class I SAM-dependent methyltransferase [Bacteroidota bacterium]